MRGEDTPKYPPQLRYTPVKQAQAPAVLMSYCHCCCYCYCHSCSYYCDNSSCLSLHPSATLATLATPRHRGMRFLCSLAPSELTENDLGRESGLAKELDTVAKAHLLPLQQVEHCLQILQAHCPRCRGKKGEEAER